MQRKTKTYLMVVLTFFIMVGLLSCNNRRNTAKKRYKRVKGCNCATFSQLQIEFSDEIIRTV